MSRSACVEPSPWMRQEEGFSGNARPSRSHSLRETSSIRSVGTHGGRTGRLHRNLSFCNSKTAAGSGRVRLGTNFLLITFDFGVDTNFISEHRVRMLVCLGPDAGERVLSAQRLTAKWAGGSAGGGGRLGSSQPPGWLPCWGTGVRGEGGWEGWQPEASGPEPGL